MPCDYKDTDFLACTHLGSVTLCDGTKIPQVDGNSCVEPPPYPCLTSNTTDNSRCLTCSPGSYFDKGSGYCLPCTDIDPDCTACTNGQCTACGV